MLATQYSYGTLGRRSQLDDRYIDNYIESAKRNNLYQKGTRERLRAMTHDQLQAFANDEDRIKFKYGSDTEIGLPSTDEIDEYMDTLGLSWNTEFKDWE